ncbi:MAG: WHG domain-containing protein [Defluviitaleaceae bacterium]|nr:WHG domain-containing protein [Defluviitaleaceae bacterium]
MAKIDKQMITQVAAGMANKNGLEKVTLKELAKELGIRSPSLYNHIQGLDELRNSVMLYGWSQLGNSVAMSAIGKSGDEAVRAMCKSYRDYIMANPGVFDAMMWLNRNSSQEAEQTTDDLARLVAMILAGYNLGENEKIHASRMFRSFLQGFCSIDKNNCFSDPVPVQESFDFAVEILIKGLASLEK